MQKLGLNEVRKKFLNFFESKGHYVAHSYPLVPQNDPSLLLINAGMAPLKNYFMGKEEPPKNRMVTCQKCIRTGDIENVGKTARHATFFEMMGNFSFGNYFKTEAIEWAWEFSTEHLKMPIDKVWVSVYQDDDDAYDIWTKEIGVSENRMVRLGKDDNFWEIGTGPCGPCSELYFDRGEKYGCENPDCKPGCDCDRFIEFWNLVFTQFDKDDSGVYNPLPNPNIDTGMGLERIACIMQNVDNIFEVDTIKHILNGVLEISNAKYNVDDKTDVSIRIITDHIRAVTFLVGDGVLPSNEGRGYVLRRLLRRAARHGKLLGVKGSFLSNLVDRVIEVIESAYPEIKEKEEYIKKIIKIEEERFAETIDQGMEILKVYINELKDNNVKMLSGENAFKLYDTYGFPIDLTREILEEENFSIDEKEFEVNMKAQRERARNARHNEDAGWKDDIFASLDKNIKTQFAGYNSLKENGCVRAIVKDDECVSVLNKGDKAIVILDKTTFYGESGGQSGDKGLIYNENFKAKVIDTKKGINDRIHHYIVVEDGSLKLEDDVITFVEDINRNNTAKNHSATHLLHKALKEVLGEHINQAGSLCDSDRLRFDFTHFEAISKDDLSKVERLVNEKISDALNVNVREMSIEKAKEEGAVALFGEKYSDNVRVVSMGEFSMELCGGTHIKNTSQIGVFKILYEAGIASGVRRIEAITGINVYNYIIEKENTIKTLCETFKTKEDSILQRGKSLVEENKNLEKELASLKNKMSMSCIDDILKTKYEINGVNVVTFKFNDMDMDSLRNMADTIKDKLESAVVVLATNFDGKVNFVATVTKDVIQKGAHAGNIVKEVAKIAGGNGGGKPNMAQAGGKDSSKIDDALNHAKDVISLQLNK